ncbi:signal recognition particle, SRP19 subunit [Xylariomycetidae sp. FL0641]|nr:signal recognition particle, SRP19 subunit [Xylariomycetidae sp. FL0641]
MSRARVEEVSDSEISDPSEGDIDDFADSDILRAVSSPNLPPPTATTTTTTTSSAAPMVNPTHAPAGSGGPQIQAGDIKDWAMLYPVYFDASRTRAQGRRVPASLAVANPLAREVAAACAALRLQPVFEAHRVHPGDWANPGRVRVLLKPGSNPKHQKNPYAAQIRNKHHLYRLVAQHLQAHPTTEHSEALRAVRVAGLPGLPAPGEPWPRPAVPRGWKLNELLPAYSAAMTGGGVSEDAFKDMMREMQGGGGGGPGGMPPGAGGGGMADMMNMLGGMGGGGPGAGGLAGLMGGGGGGAGGAAAGGSASGGGGKKGKKGKK